MTPKTQRQIVKNTKIVIRKMLQDLQAALAQSDALIRPLEEEVQTLVGNAVQAGMRDGKQYDEENLQDPVVSRFIESFACVFYNRLEWPRYHLVLRFPLHGIWSF